MKTKTLFTIALIISSLIVSAQTPQTMKEFNPAIRTVDEIQMVYYSFTGPYMQSFDDFGQLMGHIQANNLPMGAYSLGIYYDDPNVVPENELRSEIGYMVTAPVSETKKFKYKKIPAGKAVSVRYTSMDEIYPAYEAISKYIMENKIETESFSLEIYYSNDPSVIDAEILMPIKSE
jgi:effector-binding domain-containing protein